MSSPRSPFLRRTLVVGRIAGVEIAVHITWFAIFIGLTLAARYGIVPEAAPRLKPFAASLLAVGFSLLFYVFVLAHEFAHAMVARAYGLRAARITLFFFGGVAQIGREARDPSQEFRVAVAGPLTSLMLAAVLAAVARLIHPGTDAFPGLWGAFAAINLALAVFNLIPGFPLDGGRILRSALWAVTRDRARATRWAAAGGKVVAFGLMGAGAIFLVTGGGAGKGAVPGLWGLMLGWFLYGMAGGAGAAEGGAAPTEAAAVAPKTRARRVKADKPPRVREPVAPPKVVEPKREPKPKPESKPRPEPESKKPEPAPEPVHESPRDAAIRLDRVLFGDQPVRAERPAAIVDGDEGEAASSNARSRRSRAKEGPGAP